MRNLVSPINLALIALVAIAIQMVLVNPVKALVKLANRDDWASVRDRASRLTHRPSRLQPTRAGMADYFLGLANLVLGDLVAAERTFERALDRPLPAGVRAAVHRQLAAVAAMSGRTDEAIDRLATPDTLDPQDPATWHVQRALVLLKRDEPNHAVTEARRAIELVEARLELVHTSEMRAALIADQVVARTVLVRALLDAGDVEAAVAEWDGHLRDHTSDRPYVRGNVAETGAVVAHASGDASSAHALAAAARSHYEEVGAQIDLVRCDVIEARLARDRTRLAAAEERLARLGASGYRHEVEAARRDIDRAG